MPRRKRIGIKNLIKREAFGLCVEWLQARGMKKCSISKEKPLFRSPVRVVLKIYLNQSKTLDVHNLSIKHFLDELVSMGVLIDDSEKFIPEAAQRFCGYVKTKGYCEFLIEEI